MKKIIIIPFLFVSLIVSATKYHVKNGGSDAANGLTDGTAWATVSKVNGFTFVNAADSVAFKCSDTWRETLIMPRSGTSGSYFTVCSYGTGDKPKILGSTEVTAWTNDAGNVWYSNNTVADPNAYNG